MAVPKRRTSKSKKRKRQANKGLKMPSLVRCSQCHQLKLPHHVCPNCGYYKGKKVIEVTE